MKRIAINITVALLTFASGIIVDVNRHIFEIPRALKADHISGISNQIYRLPTHYQPDIREIIYAHDAPIKIWSIRFSDEDSPKSDILIELENTSSKKITYARIILAPFNDCAGSEYPGSPSVS